MPETGTGQDSCIPYNNHSYNPETRENQSFTGLIRPVSLYRWIYSIVPFSTMAVFGSPVSLDMASRASATVLSRLIDKLTDSFFGLDISFTYHFLCCFNHFILILHHISDDQFLHRTDIAFHIIEIYIFDSIIVWSIVF